MTPKHDLGPLPTEAAVPVSEIVARLIESDPHSWSSRPCQTCQSVTNLIGRPFGCNKKANRLEDRLMVAMKYIREAGSNLDPTMQWAQKMAAWALDTTGQFPYPGDRPV